MSTLSRNDDKTKGRSAAVPRRARYRPSSLASLRRSLRRSVSARVDSFAIDRVQAMARRAKRGARAETRSQAFEAISQLADTTSGETPSPEHVEAVAAALEQLWDRGTGRIRPSKRLRQAVIDQFHRIYYGTKKTTWHNTYYRGVKIWKCPLDVWLYQEIVHEVQPDLIIETGTAFGGSGYFLADLCESMGRGHVVSIDIKARTGDLSHPRLTLLIGSSIDPTLKKDVLDMLPEGGKTLIILDSDHSRRHVLEEMRLWHDAVSTGSYLIVEDSNVNGHPVHTRYGPGPWEAVDEFMQENSDFEIDESKHKFLMTLNPRGYLKKVR